MGKFNCKCGWQISDVMCPSPDESLLINDCRLDELNMYSGKGEDIYVMVSESSRTVLNCSECGRIHIESRIGSNTYETYIKENNDSHKNNKPNNKLRD